MSIYYDPMISKFAVYGKDREQAIERMRRALMEYQIGGIKTTLGFFREVMEDPEFIAGRLDTGFIGERLDSLVPADEADQEIWETAASFLLDQEESPAAAAAGFRLNADPRRSVALTHHGETRAVEAVAGASGATGILVGEHLVLFEDGNAYEFALASRGTGHHHAHDGDIVAPMPGKVIAVDVAAGDQVTAGQRLLVLEAMKMEHALAAPFDGIVTELAVSAGSQVQVEAVLAVVEANPPRDGEVAAAKGG